MKAKIFTVITCLLALTSNVRASGIFDAIGKREAGDLGPVFWIPVSIGVIVGIIIVFSTTGKYTNDSKPHA